MAQNLNIRLFSCMLILIFTNDVGVNGTKKRDQLDSKVAQLLTGSSRDRTTGLLSLDSGKFKYLVRQQPRNYSVFAMFTAMKPERKCHICRVAYEAFRTVSFSWTQSPNYDVNKTDVFFVMVDYDNAPEIFQMMKMQGAPNFRHFPRHDSLKSRHDKFDIHVKGFDADGIARWVTERMELPRMRILQPPDYSQLVFLLGSLAVVGLLAYTQRSRLHYLYNRNLWAVIVLFFTFIFMSGQMWNSIRNPPFSNKNQRTGEQSYFVRSTGSQYVVETYIVAGLYALTTLGMVMLNEVHGKKLPRWIKQGVAFGGLAVYFAFANVILAMFQAKQHSYPYNFFLKI